MNLQVTIENETFHCVVQLYNPPFIPYPRYVVSARAHSAAANRKVRRASECVRWMTAGRDGFVCDVCHCHFEFYLLNFFVFFLLSPFVPSLSRTVRC